jgi:RNA polymerase-interacting CarD/CdnL/TRCF family regulator
MTAAAPCVKDLPRNKKNDARFEKNERRFFQNARRFF